MRISGNEPSLLILSQTMLFKKLKSDGSKVLKHADAKRDGVINSQITISINFNTENFDVLYATNQPKLTEALGDSLVHRQ